MKGVLARHILAFYLVIFLSSSVLADSLGDAYQAGASFGSQAQSQAIQVAKSTPSAAIPGFQTSNPTETGYNNGNIDTAATAQVATDPAGSFVDQSAATHPAVPLPSTDPVVTSSQQALTNASSTETGSGAFCSDMSCANTSYTPSPDFGQAASGLSAAADASKNMQEQQEWWFKTYAIFTGAANHCRIIPAGFSDCCADSGWGQNSGLASCNANEQQLGLAKEAGLCHYVGDYCSHKIHILGHSFCTEHSKGYCCFSSMLGRIVQEQGRAQIGMGWGSGNGPYCVGFTPQQLQSLNFGAMDFSEYFNTLNQTVHSPNVSGTQSQITQQIEQQMQSGGESE